LAFAASACGGSGSSSSASDSPNVCTPRTRSRRPYTTMASNVSTAASPAAVQQDLDQGKANVQAQQAALEQDIASSCSCS